jgi:protoporphyrin/coproporphyrin ferrochelatase
MSVSADAAPYDALLLLSFGGPEGPDDVMPFLRNVTRGRGVPEERLAEVAEHYQAFGGVSPINRQCRELLGALRAELGERGPGLPVYWGNRNWDPLLADTMERMARDGVRRAAVFVTAAYASYSGCRQYREDLADAARQVGERDLEPPALDKLRHYFNHPGFVEPMVTRTVSALDALPRRSRAGARLAFTTHSIPLAQARSSGPRGQAYVAQHRETAALVAEGVRARTGLEVSWELVYQSRSGPPGQPWLEPDIREHLELLRDEGVPGVVMVPIGFVSDHMEVIFDLDTEAVQRAGELDLTVVRAATVGTDPRFVAMIRELVLERAAAERGEPVVRRVCGTLNASHDVCPAACCPNPRAPRPAAAE